MSDLEPPNRDANPSAEPIRPRDLAMLLLASGDVTPRQRARDQQADRTGLQLKRHVLEGVLARDPEPEELEPALMEIVEGMEPPTGPARSVALAFLEDWQAACVTPHWIDHLLGEALRPQPGDKQRGRQFPA